MKKQSCANCGKQITFIESLKYKGHCKECYNYSLAMYVNRLRQEEKYG